MVRPPQFKTVRKAAWILAVSVALAGPAFAATTHTTRGQSNPPAALKTEKMGTTCIFTAGPKAGTTQDYAPMQMPVDTPCNDGAGSTGVILPIATSQQMGTVCKFTAGPRVGDTQDYAPMHAPLNTPCKDGSGSTGVIVASPAKGETAVSRQTGTVCKFTAGPKSGSTQDYAPMQAPLDMPCTDGAGSSGVIVASASLSPTASAETDTEMGSICKFTAGPKAGTMHDYAPMHSPLNTACDDGAGSSGVIVAAQQMGSVCKFTAGPKAGTTVDYAPMHSPLNSACDDGAGSSGVIVAAPPKPAMGSVCKFTAGPKAGTTVDYAPMHSPLNTACDDGAGSSGVIVAATIPDVPSCTPPSACKVAPLAAKPSAAANSSATGASGSTAGLVGLGSVCKLTSGPKAGTTYDFAPMQAAVGAPCNYGPDNTGVIIAGTSQPPPKPVAPEPVMGSICSFTSGPLALTTADFSPKRAALGTPCTDGHGSRGVIVEH